LAVRKRHVIAALGVLVTASVGVTIYLIRHPIRRAREDVIEIGAREAFQKVSLSELLKKAPRTETSPPPVANEETTTQPTAIEATNKAQAVLVHPKWKTGTTRVEGAYAVSGAEGYAFPKWSPLGSDVAFTRPTLRGLLVTGQFSSLEREISEDWLNSPDFEWSRDGMSIVVRDRDARTVEVLLTGEKYPKPERPRRVYERDGQIYWENEEGEAQRVSGNQDRFADPVLSPDEMLVVYRGRETGLYISSVDGKRTISLGEGEHPAWLPDSSGVVYDIPVSDGSNIVDGDLWFASADGTERTNITNTPGIIESHPAVSPDGERIAFIAGGAVYIGKFVRPKTQP
jgi:hypothetical protein